MLYEPEIGDLVIFQESRIVNGVSTLVDVSFPDFIPGVTNGKTPIVWRIGYSAFNDGTSTLRSGCNTLMNIRLDYVMVRPA